MRAIPSIAPRRRQRGGWTVPRQHLFLATLAKTGSVARASARAGLSVSAAYRLRGHPASAAFRTGWTCAIADFNLARFPEPCHHPRRSPGGVVRKWTDGELMRILRHDRVDADYSSFRSIEQILADFDAALSAAGEIAAEDEAKRMFRPCANSREAAEGVVSKQESKQPASHTALDLWTCGTRHGRRRPPNSRHFGAGAFVSACGSFQPGRMARAGIVSLPRRRSG